MLNKFFLNNPFVLSVQQLEKDTFFDRYIKLNNSYLYLNNDTHYCECGRGSSNLILIGYLLDIRDGKKSTINIMSELLELYLESEEEFYKHLNYINGRYVLFFTNNNDTKIFTDATSMFPVFYYKNEIFSSHEILIREIVKKEYKINLKISEYRMKNFLDYTNTEQIYRFNPNLYFTFQSKEFKRFFPREYYKIQNLETVIDNTSHYYFTQLPWLINNYNNIYISLTGGFDSKLSLALVKPIISDVQFFTYMFKFNENTRYNSLNRFNKIYYKDKIIVDNLVYNFNLKHKYFYFEDYDMPENFSEELSKHVSSYHSYKLSYLTTKEFERESIHVKSTLYELAKLPYNIKADMKTDDNWMIRAIRQWAPKEIKNDEKLLKEMYKEYKRRNKVKEIIDQGYNLPLMLYWEFRMGNWHGSLTQETDFIMETFIFINNRYMLNQLISLSREDREMKKYLTTLVKTYWPALNYFQANTFNTLEDIKE